jgi:hypothetical protein
MRTETKYLFSEGVSPHIKSLILKTRAGINLNENEKRKLIRFNESLSMVEIPKNRTQLVPKKPIQEPNEDEEIDLAEILREMGYGEDEEEDGTEMTTYLMKDLYDEVLREMGLEI